MEITYGNGGWVRVLDPDVLPGALYLRLDRSSETGTWGVRDFYLEGEWRQVVGADLRELNLAGLVEIVLSEADHIEELAHVEGPDLRLLASYFGTRFGSGIYGGRHCEHCEAPLRGRRPREPERWSNHWVALSWFAQYQASRIHKPKPGRDTLGSYRPEGVPRLQRPTAGLTDEFLGHVAAAYRQAVAEGKHPAPELARQVGDHTSDRTIHKWVAVARERGIMPRPKKGN